VQGDNPQTAIMNKLMLYVFPIGVVVGAPFLPLAVLLYWVANNLWTLGQQYVVYKRIDREQTEKRETAVVNRQSLAPKPGQKPIRPEPVVDLAKEKISGPKPVTRKPVTNNGSRNGSTTNGTAGAGVRSGGGSRPPARKPRKRR
jgi:YidC/Oxa1 family membrane protein insertase